MNVFFTSNGWNNYSWWMMNNDRKSLKRLLHVINDIRRSPFEGIGKPEPLRGNWSG